MPFLAKLTAGLVIAHLFWGVSFLIGRLAILSLENLSRVTPQEAQHRVLRPALLDVVLATAAGVAILTLVLFIMGTAHEFSGIFIGAFLLALIAALWLTTFKASRRHSLADLTAPLVASLRPVPIALYAFCLAVAPPALLAPTLWDTTMYHLADATNWANAGFIYTDKYLHFPLFPFNVELLFGMCYALHVGEYAQFISWATYVFATLGIFAATIYLVRRLRIEQTLPTWSIETTAALAAFSFALSPMVLRYADVAYVEIPISFYLLAMCAALLCSLDDFTVYGTVCALIGGLLIGSKLQLIALLPIVAALLFYASRVSRKNIRVIAYVTLVLLLTASPWYIRSFLLTGDPLSPLINLAIHGSDPFWSRADFQFQGHSEDSGYASGPIALPLASILNFVRPGEFGEFGASANVALIPLPLIVVVIVALLPSFRKRYVALQLTSIVASCALALAYASSHTVARYTLYEYPLYLVILGSAGVLAVTSRRFVKVAPAFRGFVVPLVLVALMIPNPMSTMAYGGILPLYTDLPNNVANPGSYLSANVQGYAEAEDIIRFMRASKVEGNVLDVGAMYLAYFFREARIVSMGDWIGPGRYSELIDAVNSGRTAQYLEEHKVVAVLLPPRVPLTSDLTMRLSAQLRSQGFVEMTPLGGDVLEFVSAAIASKAASVANMGPRTPKFDAARNVDFVKSFAYGKVSLGAADANGVTLRPWPYEYGEYQTITITSGHSYTFAI